MQDGQDEIKGHINNAMQEEEEEEEGEQQLETGRHCSQQYDPPEGPVECNQTRPDVADTREKQVVVQQTCTSNHKRTDHNCDTMKYNDKCYLLGANEFVSYDGDNNNCKVIMPPKGWSYIRFSR